MSDYIRTHYDGTWSRHEKGEARQQFERYGVCFTDDAGRPIEDEEGVHDLAVTAGYAPEERRAA